jgi:cellobiose-specific phosphotransferase system component IIA
VHRSKPPTPEEVIVKKKKKKVETSWDRLATGKTSFRTAHSLNYTLLVKQKHREQKLAKRKEQ